MKNTVFQELIMNKLQENSWTVFVPICAKRDNSRKIFFGYIFEEHLQACVTYAIKQCELSGKQVLQYSGMDLLGISSSSDAISSSSDALGQDSVHEKMFYVDLSQQPYPSIEIDNSFKSTHEITSVSVILYDDQSFTKSYYFLNDQDNLQWSKYLIEAKNKTSNVIVKRTVLSSSFQGVYAAASKFAEIPKYLTEKMTSNSARGLIVTDKLCDYLSVAAQLKLKCSELLNVQQTVLEQKNGECLSTRNILWKNWLDILLGTMLMLFVIQGDVTVMLANTTMIWADVVAEELKHLLHWMMGVPAGLKLNSQLDQFLGNFFLYHIYLWTGYLRLLKSVLASMLWYISLAGCLGFSVQLALLQDLISMMTIHIYCFYVYASRLYYFQVQALSSLWRLFRGKKWNVLRQRVDSVHYDIDQLFIGTLLFTVLLFLLPTTALYYVIFTSLRLLVLVVQGSLNVVITLINNSPVYFAFLAVFKPAALGDEPEFELLHDVTAHPQTNTTPTQYIRVKLKQRSWSKILNDARMTTGVHNAAQRDTAADAFLKKLLTGQLIYPWLGDRR